MAQWQMSETNMGSYIEGKIITYNRWLLFIAFLEFTFTKA